MQCSEGVILGSRETQQNIERNNFTYSISTLAPYVQLTQAEMAVILQKDILGEENQGIIELNEIWFPRQSFCIID